MQCQGFAPEDYDLFALGIAEPDEDSEIDAHLGSACHVCEKGVRESLRFWALYGVSLAPLADRRALGSLQVFPIGPKSAQSYLRIGAVAAAVALMVGSTAWFVTRAGDQHVIKQMAAALAKSETRATQLESANAKQPGPTAGVREPAPSPAADSGRIRELTVQVRAKEQELGGLRKSFEEVDSRYQQSVAALAAEKANATQLAGALTQQKDQLERDPAARQRLSSQIETLSASLRGTDERARRLTAETVSLNRERARLLETVQQMEAQAGEGRRMISLLSIPGTRLIPVNGTEAAPKARGYALVSDRDGVVFYATDLPPLPNGRVYQLWLIRNRSPAIVSAGIFAAQATASAQVEFTRGDLVPGITAIAVTDEPAGGSVTPTGHKLLAGLAKS